jgi:hypothetical protein
VQIVKLRRARARGGWDDTDVIEDTGMAQARELLSALNEQVADISQKLDAAEQRTRRAIARGTVHVPRQQASSLRRELYEAHRLIDGLHRRFPETRQAPGVHRTTCDGPRRVVTANRRS